MKRVIVTGANGFIGTALLKELSARNCEIWAVVRNEYSDISRIDGIPGVHIVKCAMEEITELPQRLAVRGIDICYHLAWAGSFGDARADYTVQLDNVKFTLDTICAMKEIGVSRFVGAGSLAELDVMNSVTRDEVVPSAVGMYGLAKSTAHYLSKVQCAKLGMEHVWCYLSNTYGIGNTTNNFVNMACRKMMNGERAAFTDGEQPYDFVYISDTINAMIAAAECGKNNTEYFLGSTEPRRLKQYIFEIRDAIDPKITLYLGEVPFRGIPLPWESLDAGKLVRDTGYSPQVSFERGIAETVKWLRNEGKR